MNFEMPDFRSEPPSGMRFDPCPQVEQPYEIKEVSRYKVYDANQEGSLAGSVVRTAVYGPVGLAALTISIMAPTVIAITPGSAGLTLMGTGAAVTSTIIGAPLGISMIVGGALLTLGATVGSVAVSILFWSVASKAFNQVDFYDRCKDSLRVYFHTHPKMKNIVKTAGVVGMIATVPVGACLLTSVALPATVVTTIILAMGVLVPISYESSRI